MVINFHGVVFHSHRFIYAETMCSDIHIHLEGLPPQRDFVCVSAKTQAQATTWLAELSHTINDHYRSEIAMKQKNGA